MRNSKLRNHILCAIFTALIAIGAFIRIPVPVVPFTLQFLFTTLAGVLLGSRLGAISVVLYIALGLLGVPVFAEGGGPGYILKPSFGYLPGFAIVYFRLFCGKTRSLLIQKSAAGQCFEPGCCLSVRHGLLLCNQQLLSGDTHCSLAAGIVLFHPGSAGRCRAVRGRCHFRVPACAGCWRESLPYVRKQNINLLEKIGTLHFYMKSVLILFL